MTRLDDIDVRILTLLQQDGRMKRNRIAEEVGLSLPAVSERMRKLEESGLLTGIHAQVDARQLGFDITAFIRVTIVGSEFYEAFIEHATALPEVQELHSITGDGSHLLKVRLQNTGALEQLLGEVQRVPGVRGTQTSIVLSTLKESTFIPVETAALPANGS
jgi:Lrp/AsnC family transcriptional regulator, leucine-responsive regulatory protein